MLSLLRLAEQKSMLMLSTFHPVAGRSLRLDIKRSSKKHCRLFAADLLRLSMSVRTGGAPVSPLGSPFRLHRLPQPGTSWPHRSHSGIHGPALSL